jgi:hypothetical protein
MNHLPYPAFAKQRTDGLVTAYIWAEVHGDLRKSQQIMDTLHVMSTHGNDTISPLAQDALARITKWELDQS